MRRKCPGAVSITRPVDQQTRSALLSLVELLHYCALIGADSALTGTSTVTTQHNRQWSAFRQDIADTYLGFAHDVSDASSLMP